MKIYQNQLTNYHNSENMSQVRENNTCTLMYQRYREERIVALCVTAVQTVDLYTQVYTGLIHKFIQAFHKRRFCTLDSVCILP